LPFGIIEKNLIILYINNRSSQKSMAKKEVSVNLNGQILKLSNLDKVLFPEQGIIKAELIDYALKIAPFILPFISRRPLTLIRFPDGIDKPSFYAKNKPEWTPEWLPSSFLPNKPEIQYLEANNAACLVFLSNIAALELHAMTVRSPSFLPDHFIFDLDPAENVSFDDLKELCSKLNIFLSNEGYKPYLKTSGGKGLHIYVPINPNADQNTVVERCKELAKRFILSNATSTLTLSKEKREGKVLLDIYRNHSAQTCAAPFTIRAKTNAPISMPIFWEDLATLKSSQEFTVQNTLLNIETLKNAWEDFELNSVELISAQKVNIDISKLDTYAQKRDFNKSEEPKPEVEIPVSKTPRYVVQKHRASNLHYDLRLESDGVLLSWAIPKAIPHKPGIKKMAIQTEDHPLKYLYFEGEIPKDEYGGGTMWIFDQGDVEYIEKTEKKILFNLVSGKISGQYLLFNTQENKWLIERKDNAETLNAIKTEPMLAQMGSDFLKDYFYEIKWDGIRVIIKKEGESIKIISRNQGDLSEKFPEILDSLKEIDAECLVLDGELVVLDETGLPVFSKIISRMHTLGFESVKSASKHTSATLYAFDILYLDGLDLRNHPIEKRREWLRVCFADSQRLRFSQSFDDGPSLFEAIKSKNMEGVILKKKGSPYRSGVRHADWQKIKVKNIEDALVIGYTKGKGDRSSYFGALFLAQLENNVLIYKGKVGTGFDETKLKIINDMIKGVKTTAKPIKESVEEEANAVWIDPIFQCKIQFASLTNNFTFREPVFLAIFSTKETIL
jgi:bifunctional non-homologous end joining protein LigD